MSRLTRLLTASLFAAASLAVVLPAGTAADVEASARVDVGRIAELEQTTDHDVIAFVSQVLLARWMGSFDYGIFVLVWTAMIIAGNLSCLGFHTSIIRRLRSASSIPSSSRTRATSVA